MKIRLKKEIVFFVMIVILSIPIISCTEKNYYDTKKSEDSDRSETVLTLMKAKSLNNLYAGIDIPQNPGLAKNNWNGGHQDSYSSDSVGLTGPVTKKLKLIKQFNPYGFAPIAACNSNNQMIGVSLNYDKLEYRLIVYDKDLHILCQALTSHIVHGTFSGGYFFLNNQENTVVVGENKMKCYPTSSVQDTGSIYELEPLWATQDIVAMIPDSGENSLYIAVPFWDTDLPNRYWCLLAGKFNVLTHVLKSSAYIAIVDVVPDTSQPDGCTTTLIDYMELPDQWNNNTLSVDEDGAYFVTNALSAPRVCDDGYLYAMAFDTDTGKIVQRWRYQYENSGYYITGMKNIGSGTTPTI